MIRVADIALAEPPAITVEAIFRAHAPFVWRTLHRMGVREADLADALQDVFVVVHRRHASFDGSARTTTWLFAIAARIAANHRRATGRRRAVPLAAEPVSPVETPESSLARSEAGERLLAAMATLSPAHRAVLVMYELEGLDGDEIARELGIPAGTVRSRLHHARRRVVAALPPELRPGGDR